MGCNEPKSEAKMNLTYWDETLKLMEIKRILTETRYRYDRCGDPVERKHLEFKYRHITKKIDKLTIEMWFLV